MKTQTCKTGSYVLLLSALAMSNPGFASDTSSKAVSTTSSQIKDVLTHGEKVHDNHCHKCHSDDVYTRDDRFVKSIDALSKQVIRCKDSTGAPWFDEDTGAVVQFLNTKYYKF